MLKIFGILLLSVIPILYCTRKSQQLRQQIQNLEGLIFLIRECRQGIEYQQRPIGELIDNLPPTKYKILDHFVQQSQKNDPIKAWKALPEQECPMARSIMDNFFRMLGTSDRNSQLELCDMTIGQLSHLYDQIAPDSAVKSKLYRTIGMLVGAFIAIIFI